jgi:hypothetical protein
MAVCSERIRRGSWDSERIKFVMLIEHAKPSTAARMQTPRLHTPTLPGVTCHPYCRREAPSCGLSRNAIRRPYEITALYPFEKVAPSRSFSSQLVI